MPLTDSFVKNVKLIKESGDKFADGAGMYLLVLKSGKYWRMNYRYADKRKTLALGVYPTVSLAKARLRRDEARAQLDEGHDPGITKRQVKLKRIDAANLTFETVARSWLEKTQTTRATSTQQKIIDWLEKNVFPYLGPQPITMITPRDVLTTVQRIEARGAIETAHRVKQVCGQIFRYAVAAAMVERDIAADLKGALAQPRKTHYAAITEPKQAAELMRAIYDYQGHPFAVAALKLSAMLFVRPGELRAAEWTEFDLDAAQWRIPGAKMKMKIDHIVPLPTQAVQILRSIAPMTAHGKYVFPSIRTDDRCMSENTINAALRSMGYTKTEMTAHGFRAMARTMLDEILGERVDLVEHQLAHAVIDPNGRAYNRTAHLPARRQMMQRWADYLDNSQRRESLKTTGLSIFFAHTAMPSGSN